MFPWNLFPVNKDTKKMMQQVKPEEIDKYVKNIMGQMIPQHMQGMMNPQEYMQGFGNQASPDVQTSTLPSSVFETHDHVYVRVAIKKEEWLKEMKLYHTSNQMIIEHIPELNDKHTITLPALVRKKGTTANFKEGTLEIKIPKNVDMQFSEIDVTEI
ncbi:Hsp20/alpha crystallin family protein [Bacillus sp. FJAT-29790]|uniref:Hsp20/alpha crystallin family protein n=1 Tax=Bacillus sp. FJAT-29790 TaxID=1895002 RepID=UPI001C216089|nr:Hsp20/alpha crystallin family protein [Bacillus sp. FJAT-29790]MBU8878900.1 Hsp20/alpha crystallin family protein [Bacillus sp. FJAT-29790]